MGFKSLRITINALQKAGEVQHQEPEIYMLKEPR